MKVPRVGRRRGESFGGVCELRKSFPRAYVAACVTDVSVLQTTKTHSTSVLLSVPQDVAAAATATQAERIVRMTS